MAAFAVLLSCLLPVLNRDLPASQLRQSQASALVCDPCTVYETAHQENLTILVPDGSCRSKFAIMSRSRADLRIVYDRHHAVLWVNLGLVQMHSGALRS